MNSELKKQLEAATGEIEQLRAELGEARETLAAIQSGAVDALVINGSDGQRIYTLDGAEHGYRTFIERMHDGAVILDADGTIQYCNGWFAQLLQVPLESVIGSVLEDWVRTEDRDRLRALLAERAGRLELEFCVTGAAPVPTLVSTIAESSGAAELRLIITDLSERKRYEAGIVQLNAQLEQRIQERTAELEAANALLKDADRRKDEFLAVLSHELRNPLAPIRTASHLLDSPHLPPSDLLWARTVIQRQVRHMSALLDDLLDIARITRGRMELKIRRVNLKSVVDAAVEAARPLIDRNSHNLVVTLPDPDQMLDADPLRLAQILSNLLTNAAKYTDAGGQIELSSEVADGRLRISVRDNGIGLAPSALSEIFTMFSQVDGSAGRSEGGLGIGLALVKGLVTLHRGTVRAHSAGKGRGSEFIVEVPVATTRTEPVAPPVADTTPPVGSRRVLVADDNRDAADTLGLLLELYGHEVRIAHSGNAALEVAHSFRPNVALLDIAMPDLSGYDVARNLRLDASCPHIVLIALTGYGQDGDKERAHEAGFDHHLTKPVDPSKLEALISGY
ncbi:MAG TPA: ATP-binding protein [Steroidobacteraceae bacterium]|nr:ATP-binding protein [Steroidobacteraceae bacterium]